MLAPSELSPRARNLAAAAIHRCWGWVSAVGSVSPADARGRRFRAMGPSSCIAFPPGSVFGERWIEIGAGALIGPHVSLAVGMPDEPIPYDAPAVIVVGDRCCIGRGSSIVGRCRIEIGDDVTTGPDVYITDHNHSYADVDVPIGRQWPEEDPVRIGPGSWLGAGVIVLPGADIGRHVVVAAGSVVRGRIPDCSVIAGVPARVVRRHVAGQGWVPPIPPQVINAPEGWQARGAAHDGAPGTARRGAAKMRE